MRDIVVVPHNPQWPAEYNNEARQIAGIFAALSVEIHHIGSTAVPGLAAKPIIDIMLVVRNIEKVSAYNDQMSRIGYEAKGEYGIPGRRYFRKGGDSARSHHVHAYEPNHQEIKRHLIFRDYLRAHPNDASRYASLKQELALVYRHDIEGYVAGKSSLIEELLQKAEVWRNE